MADRFPLKNMGFYGCALALVGVLTVAVLFVVGLIQTNWLAFCALLALIGAAITGTLAGAASARRRRRANAEHSHQHR
jgi:hypothetical protein